VNKSNKKELFKYSHQNRAAATAAAADDDDDANC